MMKKNLHFILILLSLIFSSCASPQKILKTPLEISPDVKQKLSHLEKTPQAIDTLVGFIEITFKRKKRQEQFEAAIIFSKPNQIYLSFLNELGQEYLRLSANGTRVLLKKEADIEEFPQDTKALKKVLRLPISITELISRMRLEVFTQNIQNIENGEQNQHISFSESSEFIFQKSPPRLLQWKNYQPKRSGKAKQNYTLDYQDFKNVEGVDFPHRMVWKFRKPKMQVTVDFLKVKFHFDSLIPGEIF